MRDGIEFPTGPSPVPVSARTLGRRSSLCAGAEDAGGFSERPRFSPGRPLKKEKP